MCHRIFSFFFRIVFILTQGNWFFKRREGWEKEGEERQWVGFYRLPSRDRIHNPGTSLTLNHTCSLLDNGLCSPQPSHNWPGLFFWYFIIFKNIKTVLAYGLSKNMQEDQFGYRPYFPVSKILKPELRKGDWMSLLWSAKCKEESVRLAQLLPWPPSRVLY